jgi:hypothetical protein
MFLDVSLLEEIYDSFREKDLPLVVREVVAPGFKESVFKAGEPITREKLDFLHKNRINRLEVFFSRPLLAALNQYKPSQYKLPNQVFSRDEFVQELKFIHFANRHSRYQRHLLSSMEITDSQGNFILRYDEALDLKKWQAIGRSWPTGVPIAFRYSEHKILLFLNLKIRGDKVQSRFAHNLKIIDLLTQRMQEFREFINLSKLNFEEDVVIVDEPEKLMDTYSQSDVRLILIGDGIEPEFRQALVNIKKYDPYARFMLAQSANPDEEEAFLLSVEGNYTRDNWK